MFLSFHFQEGFGVERGLEMMLRHIMAFNMKGSNTSLEALVLLRPFEDPHQLVWQAPSGFQSGTNNQDQDLDHDKDLVLDQ